MNSSCDTAKMKQFYTDSDDDVTQRCFNLQKTQNVNLIWLDSYSINRENATIRLQQIVNTVNYFDDSDECVDFIEIITDNNVCMIISASLDQNILPCIHDKPKMNSILIFGESIINDKKSIREWSKVKSNFIELPLLREALKNITRPNEQNAISMSFVAPDEELDKLDPAFVYTQIIKQILLTIEFEEKRIKQYIDYCRDTFVDNAQPLEHVRQFEHEYYQTTPIRWYSSEIFLHTMLNRALRVMDGSISADMGLFY
ncbi:hypothetical protein I4U23_024073 [Adineta vaga]|nr:hypothetical protein I4U23_024073 [Adineta vaga]